MIVALPTLFSYFFFLHCLFRLALTWAYKIVLAAGSLKVFASLLYQRYIYMLKDVLFSLFTSSLSPISGSTIMSPKQY